MLDYEQIGKQIALLRKEKGLTGEKLSELLQVSPQAVSKWETGKCLPETALLPGLAKVLGCSIDSLLMPRELMILEAIYTDGQSAKDLTQMINNLVHGNRLHLCVNSHWIPESLEGNRLKLLTLKVQSSKGVFYTYALQNEDLTVDLNSTGAAAEDFTILGAYYGNEKEFSCALRKMEHYAYFQWKIIHVNHETFPSLTASDDPEYLTLVYLNKKGVHVISCEENDRIYYSEDRTSLYLKEEKGQILLDIMRLQWGEGMECPWAGALYASLQYMGENYSYTQLMGLSGACYRVCFVDVWDWSCTDALVSFPYWEPLFKAIGYEAVWANRLEKGQRKAERQAIVKDIQNGKPVLAINLRVAPEWGVITGYIENGNAFLCRTYFDKEIFEAHKEDSEFCKETGGYLVNDFWPFLIIHFGTKKEKPSDLENLIASLHTLIQSFIAPQNRGYTQGKEAYEAWIQGLSKEENFSGKDKESICRRLGVNDSMLFNLIDARRSAEGYLRECVTLLPAEKQSLLTKIADNYGVMHRSLSEFWSRVPFCYDTEMASSGPISSGASTPDLRREQICLLEDMIKLEEENVALAREILEP